MRRFKPLCALLLTLLLLTCAACGQQAAQPEDTGDKDQFLVTPLDARHVAEPRAD